MTFGVQMVNKTKKICLLVLNLMMSNLSKNWKAIWNPDMYHGWGKEKSYFEGWYFKIVDPTEQYVFAIIPGISKEEDGKQEAFIQLLDGANCKAEYIAFDKDKFVPGTDRFELDLGQNYFSAKAVKLDLPTLKGQLELLGTTPWPKMLGAPGIMGWYGFMPFMECYHGVVSLNHHLKGELVYNGTAIDFDGGKGYIEKDWGKSFPSAWIWSQTNHFEADRKISLMASVAKIPWLGSSFIGYLVGFYLDDQLYRFATYTGAKMKASLTDYGVQLSFKDRNQRIEIEAHKAPGADLISPISGKMTGKVNESMQAQLNVKFYQKDKLVYEGTGKNAGLELAGDVDKLLTEKWRR